MDICKSLHQFEKHLRAEEHSTGTIDKYLRDARQFAAWLGERTLCRDAVADWKAYLLASGCRPVTINSKLAALNALFRFLDREDCRVRFLKVQRRMFRESDRELSRDEYTRLVATAARLGKERLALLMESICATGIRVSEVQYLTVEAARTGRSEVSLKGKIRTILLPKQLCRKLLSYAKRQNIHSGQIFLARSGNALSRRQIWAEMKALCDAAGVEASKVFPHNLRHLFATAFYKVSRDIVRLADVLGHSSIETTRIYLISTGAEHARQLNQLGLLIT